MAIATTAKTVTTTWQNVGPGPLYMQRSSGAMRCAIQAAQPGVSDPGFSIDADRDEYTVTVAENVWVRSVKAGETSRLVVVTLA